MRRNRTGLLFAATLGFAFSAPLWAQTAPSLTGETGLFELTNAETLPAGRFSIGLYFNQSDRTAAESLLYPRGADNPLRYSTGKLGVSVGFGLTNHWELTLTAGQRYYSADDRSWSGDINGHAHIGELKHSETDKIRIGTKLLLNPNENPVKVALFGGWTIPTQSRSDVNALSTHRSDWDFGLSLNYKVFTFQASYVLMADRDNYYGSSDFRDNYDIPNEFRWGAGVNVPLIPKVLKGIAEINRVHYDGGLVKPDDFSEVTLGARLAFGDSGLTASGAVRVNIDRWTRYGGSPNAFGGLLQLAYLPPAGPADTLQRVPAREAEPVTPAAVAPAAEPVPTSPAPAPAPITEPAPSPKTATSTTDEILFDAAKAKLTNIAKAILDGVALRLKNNLSAGCTVVAHTDPKEKGGDHAALARARAEAAKDYLVKRHGIDASRIKLDAKGDVDAGSDPTRNRRAVVTVTFP